ncbi:hypothetical protein [Staphylococcus equorum]|uniref:Uncharacterized protein n=1 Tax=Staphylococcus equorum TaxID=246432 RepID=A0AAP7IFA9_9STAP|nr:hypothetical protein [Staphylococcus equorum]OEK58959.1 hypothetical protein ASS94_01135 [Staphylococcus equorum]
MEFQSVVSLKGCGTFEEFESEFDDLIFYADGSPDAVKQMVKEEGFEDNKSLRYYFFDEWSIAMWDF